MALPSKLSGGVRRDFRHAPKIGQDSVEILREAGYSDAEIEKLIAGGATLDGRIDKSG